MLRIEKTCTVVRSQSSSTVASYQSTCASPPHSYDCGTNTSCTFKSQFLFTALHVAPYRRLRHIRFRFLLTDPLPDPVRRVPLLPRRFSDSKIPSMKSATAPSFGFRRSGVFRSGGIALAYACRAIRRCTRNFFATPWIVPAPCAYSRRICSNSSTFAFLSIGLPVRFCKQNRPIVFYRWAKSKARSGPTQNSEITKQGWISKARRLA